MSEREEQSQEQEQSEDHAPEQVVQGVDTDPDDGKKSIAVDTNERLSAKDEEPDLEDIPTEELEKERQERLDPDNRPDNVEIDNSQRDFNPETGLFEDSEVEPPEEAPFSTTDAEESKSEPKDREETTDAEQSKEAKESKDTQGSEA